MEIKRWSEIEAEPAFQRLSNSDKLEIQNTYESQFGQGSVMRQTAEDRATAAANQPRDNGLGAQLGAGVDELQGGGWHIVGDVAEELGAMGVTAYARRSAANNFNQAGQVGFQTENLTDAISQGDWGSALYGGVERTFRSAPTMAATIAANTVGNLVAPGVGTAASLAIAGGSTAGGIRQEQIERGNDDKMSAYLAGAAGGALERVGLKASRLLPTGKVAAEAGEAVAEKGLKGLAKQTGKAVVGEAGTEATQEAIGAFAAGERDLGAIAERSLEASIAGGLSGGYLSTGRSAVDTAFNLTMGNGEAAQAESKKFMGLSNKTSLLVNGETEGAAGIYADTFKSVVDNMNGVERNSPEFLAGVDEIHSNIDGLKYSVEADVMQQLADMDTPINGNLFDADMGSRYEFNEGLGYKIGSKLQGTFAADQEIQEMNNQKNNLDTVYQNTRSGTNQILSNLQKQNRGVIYELNRAKALKRNATTPEARATAQTRINELTALRGAYADDLSLVRGIYEGIKTNAPDASPEKMKLALNFDLAAGTNLATQLQKAATVKGMDTEVTNRRSMREGAKAESAALKAGLAVGTMGTSVIGQAIAGRVGTSMKRRAQRNAAKNADFQKESVVDSEIQSELNPEMELDAALERVDRAVREDELASAFRNEKAPAEGKDDSTAYAKAAANQGNTESLTGNELVDTVAQQLQSADSKQGKVKTRAMRTSMKAQGELDQALWQTRSNLARDLTDADLPEDQYNSFRERIEEELSSENTPNKSHLQYKARRIKKDIAQAKKDIQNSARDSRKEANQRAKERQDEVALRQAEKKGVDKRKKEISKEAEAEKAEVKAKDEALASVNTARDSDTETKPRSRKAPEISKRQARINELTAEKRAADEAAAKKAAQEKADSETKAAEEKKAKAEKAKARKGKGNKGANSPKTETKETSVKGKGSNVANAPTKPKKPKAEEKAPETPSKPSSEKPIQTPKEEVKTSQKAPTEATEASTEAPKSKPSETKKGKGNKGATKPVTKPANDPYIGKTIVVNGKEYEVTGKQGDRYVVDGLGDFGEAGIKERLKAAPETTKKGEGSKGASKPSTPKQEPKVEPVAESVPEPKVESKSEPKVGTGRKEAVDPRKKVKDETKPEPKPEPKADTEEAKAYRQKFQSYKKSAERLVNNTRLPAKLKDELISDFKGRKFSEDERGSKSMDESFDRLKETIANRLKSRLGADYDNFLLDFHGAKNIKESMEVLSDYGVSKD